MLQLPFPTHATHRMPDAVVRDGEPLFRLIDLIIAAMLLVMLAPLLLVAAFAVWASDGASPIFAQRRLGRGGRPFLCLKFRTMAPEAGGRFAIWLIVEAARRFGRRFVRPFLYPITLYF